MRRDAVTSASLSVLNQVPERSRSEQADGVERAVAEIDVRQVAVP